MQMGQDQLKTSVQCTMFVKHNIPMDKICKLDLIIVGEDGKDKDVVASLELDVKDHFGQSYA